ncbi:MAG: two-component sensor histidine kinase [Ahniella sp.]|nr:two-component sensor histidine kinase [Ahniella sp.]
MRDRLQGYVWSYLSGSDLTVKGELILPEVAPEPRFERPQSGLYAGVSGEQVGWRSPSALGRDLPFEQTLDPGRTSFEGPLASNVGGVYVFSQGVAWEQPDGKEVRLTFHVAEHESALRRQINVYRTTLMAYLGTAALVLFLVQLLMLRWSLRPLRQVSNDLARVERGEQEALPDRYPRELKPLTRSINDVIGNEREQRTRYRNTLGDLAHSLKTPLAVIRSTLDEPGELETAQRDVLADQVRRMDEIVAYQLARAAASGHSTYSAPVPIEAHAESIVSSLEKVYAAQGVLCEFEIEPDVRFYGEQGDLLELLGNLLENAFKWAKGRVLLTISQQRPPGARRPGLTVLVEDNGPGIPDEKSEQLLKRGVRGDERVQGHGIGLSIVTDIVRSYRGELTIDQSEELGGARFTVRFPPVV